MTENHLEKALALLADKKFVELKNLLLEMNPADIALLLGDIPEEHLPLVYRILPKELAAEVFVEMDVDHQELLIKTFNDKELREVLDELFVDDTVYLIEEMPAGVVKRILRNTDPETRNIINQILHYPQNSAGSIMTTEYVRLQKDMTVSDAFVRIRQTGVDKETIYTCYVTDHNRMLLGVVTVRELLLAKPTDLVGELMETHVISVETGEDKEETAQMMSKYDFIAMPVVDSENRLVGIITFDDALDVLEEAATEDISKMGAVTPTDKPYLKLGIIELWKARVPWLLLLMVSATFTGMIITSFEDALSAYVVLTAFIPMLMDTGGNSGSQASVTIIRALSLGDIEFSDLGQIVWKEIRVSLLCGLTLAAANFAKLMLFDRVGMSVAAVVCITLVFTVFVAKLVGCTLPILADKIGFDPTVMASPFITTIVDAVALLIYFEIAAIVLHI